jgi:two-component system NtrC family response regulator
MATVLIIDDDRALRESLAETVSAFGHKPLLAGSGENGLSQLDAERVDAMLLDLRMPGMDGLEVLRQVRRRTKPPPVVVLTAFATAANTIEAMRLGAFDHLTKPVGRKELAELLERMLRKPATASPKPPPAEDPIIGSSEAMRAVQKAIGLLADSDTNVLILGETGTGKELMARALHWHGRRGNAAFVAVNCAAIPPDLLESELFGHVRGAFTGATADRRGAFREADKGTLLLDEIGDMPVAMQAKILRVLEERLVTPVGGRPVPVDVRVLAATHRHLPALVREGRFRDDLYYRLNVVPIALPALRERIDDIVPLAEHFLAAAAKSPKRLTQDAAGRLRAHPWPGNVRQLKNAMERLNALVRGELIDATDLAVIERETGPSEDSRPGEATGDMAAAVAGLEAEMIRRALEACGGNRAEAARRLNINRQLLYTKMRRCGLGEGEASEPMTPRVSKDDS